MLRGGEPPLELERVYQGRCERCRKTGGTYDTCTNGCFDNILAATGAFNTVGSAVVRRADDVFAELQRQVYNLKGDLMQLQDSNKTLEHALAIEKHVRVESEKALRTQLTAERRDNQTALAAKDELIDAWRSTSDRQLALIAALRATIDANK